MFKDGDNYSGSSPSIVKLPITRPYVDLLGHELEETAAALVVPLGKAVGEAVDELTRSGRLDPERCVLGFPHPSGASPHRPRLYAERRQEMAQTVQKWFGSQPPTG